MKNLGFLLKNLHFLLKNLHFLLKNVDFIIKQGGAPNGGGNIDNKNMEAWRP